MEQVGNINENMRINYSPTKNDMLFKALRHLIEEGHFRPGDRLPSESALMKEFSVSRNTVRTALSRLAAENLIETRQGQGSFAIGPRDSAGTSRDDAIALILPCMPLTIYPYIIKGVENTVVQSGYHLILGDSNNDPDREISLVEQMISRGVKGLLIEPAFNAVRDTSSPLLDLLRNTRIPFVFIDGKIRGIEASSVQLDDRAAGRIAGDHLITRGHRRIAMIYKYEITSGIDRLAGLRDALHAADIPPSEELFLAYGEADEESRVGEVLTRRLMEMQNPPTAILYFNDEIALQSYLVFREMGLTVGRDISIMGFDDISFAASAEVPLTTIGHPKYNLGRWAAELLLDAVSGKNSVTELLIRPSLVERQSVAGI